MSVFFVLRNYLFGLFSITGMETEIFWITIGGTIYMLLYPFNLLSARMYDRFGKSVYTLIFTVIEVLLEVGIIYALLSFSSNSNCVLIGIVGAAIIIAIVYYLFLNHLFKGFSKIKENLQLKILTKKMNLEDIEDKIDEFVEEETRKLPSRLPLILALIAMIIIVLEILSIPFRVHNYSLIMSGIICLIISGVSVYYMVRLHKPKLSVIGFFFCFCCSFTIYA